MGFVELDSKRVIKACDAYISFVDAYKKDEIEKMIEKMTIPVQKSKFFGLCKYVKVMTREEAEREMDVSDRIFGYSEREWIMIGGKIPYDKVVKIRTMAKMAKRVSLSEKQVMLIKDYL